MARRKCAILLRDCSIVRCSHPLRTVLVAVEFTSRAQQGKTLMAQCRLINGFLADARLVTQIPLFGQPDHGAEASQIAFAMQAVFIGLIRSADILDINCGLARECLVELQ